MSTRSSARAVNCQECAIRATCMLNRLGSEQRAGIEPQIRERIFHRGDVLVEEGEVAKFVRVLKLGIVFGYRGGLDGRSRPIGALKRGSPVGLFGTLELPSQASCIALNCVRVCEVPVFDLHSMGSCGSSLLKEFGRTMAELFASLSAWSEAMRVPGVVKQLAYVLVLLADANKASVVQLPSHAALAELLGTRRESIARALGSLESEGCIRRHERKRCEVHRDRLLLRLSQAG
jgi:CRP/FNR family transcriptional regulator, cyclic AMP receptor protein